MITKKQGGIKMDAIRIEGLRKSFGKIKAVDGLSFCVRCGELFAFLGANGAGKSTAISIICGEARPDGGEIFIDGESISGSRGGIQKKIGVVFQSTALDTSLSARDNLKSRAALYGIFGDEFSERLSELCRLFDLFTLLDRPISHLSGGQRRRIDLARALIHKPKILILDEPSTGLDPKTRAMLWQAVSALRKAQGLTVLLTTHYMEEAAEADRVLIIDKGRAVAEGAPFELKTKYAEDYITVYGQSEEKISTLGCRYERVAGAYRISVPNTRVATELILRSPELFVDYEITKGKMDDVFLAVTGKYMGGDLK